MFINSYQTLFTTITCKMASFTYKIYQYKKLATENLPPIFYIIIIIGTQTRRLSASL